MSLASIPSSSSSSSNPPPSSLGACLVNAVLQYNSGGLNPIHRLVAMGAPLEHRFFGGHTVLTWTSGQPSMSSVVVTLILLGADFHATVPGLGSDGGTALHFAVRAGLKDTCQVLLEYGADPWAPLNSSNTTSPLKLIYGKSFYKAHVSQVFENHLGIFSGWFHCRISGGSKVKECKRWLVIMGPGRGFLQNYELLALGSHKKETTFDWLELTDASVSFDRKGFITLSTWVLTLRKGHSVWTIQSVKGNGGDAQLVQLQALCIAKRVPVSQVANPHSRIISNRPSSIGEVFRNSSTVSSDGLPPGTPPASGETRQEGFSSGAPLSQEEKIFEEETMSRAIAESIASAQLDGINGINVSSQERFQASTSTSSPLSSLRNGPNVSTPEASVVMSQRRDYPETASVLSAGTETVGRRVDMGRSPPIGLRATEDEMDDEVQLALAISESLELARCAGIPTDSQNCHFTEVKKSQSLIENLSSSGFLYQSTKTDGKPTSIQPKKEAEEESEKNMECTICCTNPVNAACVPCGHMMSCDVCLEQVKRLGKSCPVCRKPINKVLKVYGL